MKPVVVRCGTARVAGLVPDAFAVSSVKKPPSRARHAEQTARKSPAYARGAAHSHVDPVGRAWAWPPTRTLRGSHAHQGVTCLIADSDAPSTPPADAADAADAILPKVQTTSPKQPVCGTFCRGGLRFGRQNSSINDFPAPARRKLDPNEQHAVSYDFDSDVTN